MICAGVVQRTEWVNSGGDLGLLRWVNLAENTVIAIAWPDRGRENDPEALGLAVHHQGPTFFNAYCQAATYLVDWD